MCLTIFLMIAFTNNFIFINQYSTYHRIRCNITRTQFRKL